MRERSIFWEAIQKQDKRQRTAYLEETCGENSELRQRVEQLIQAHESAGRFLEKPAAKLEPTLAERLFDTAEDDDDPRSVSLDFLSPSDKAGCIGTLGPYEVLEVVGRGGMGLVLRAFDTKLNRMVALKVLAPELVVNAMAVKRFLREARAGAAVSHDHVVTIFAIDETNRPPYIAMEYVNGQSLQEKIDRTGGLGVEEILRIGMQVARGLAAAHEQGLIHRDIKPGNILLENGVERVKLTDFGLARAADDVGVTRTGQINGTPQYMSPEQACGHALDARSDLFSLGSVLYALCTGRAPFRAETPLATLRRVTNDQPRPIREINADIPDFLEGIVFRLLEKHPDNRFASATEVANVLSQYLVHLQQPRMRPKPVWEMSRAPALTGPPPKPPLVGKPAVDRTTFRWSMALVLLFMGLVPLTLAAGVTVYLFADRTREVPGDLAAMWEAVRGPRGDSTRPPRPSTPPLPTPPPGELAPLRLVRRFEAHVGPMHDLKVTHDSTRLLSASADGKVRVWDLDTGRVLETLAGHRIERDISFDISPDDRHVVSGDETGQLRWWDVATGERFREILAHHKDDYNHGIYAVEYSRDGSRVLSTGKDSLAKLWDSRSGTLLQTFAGHGGWVVDGGLTPDNAHVVTASFDETIRVWDAASGEEELRLLSGGDTASCLAFSPDGRHLAAGMRDGSIRLYDLASGEEVHRLQGHEDRVRDVAYTPTGKQLVTGSYDGTLRVWTLPDGREAARAEHDAPVFNRLAITPTGHHVATGGGVWKPVEEVNRWELGDNAIRLWQLPATPHTEFEIALLIPVCAIAADGFRDTAGDETSELDGTWVVESVLRDPREDNPGEGIGLRIILSGEKVVAQLPGNEKPLGTATTRRDPTQNPKALDFLINGEETIVRAIYEAEDDTLRVCWSPPGKERPTELASNPGSGHTLVVLKRATH